MYKVIRTKFFRQIKLMTVLARPGLGKACPGSGRLHKTSNFDRKTSSIYNRIVDMLKAAPGLSNAYYTSIQMTVQ
uniref:Uncharacterized protein n=1 Tax=Romanomermis culicivorax TaxID=13658 RepID=A0A915J3L1_ROMCU